MLYHGSSLRGFARHLFLWRRCYPSQPDRKRYRVFLAIVLMQLEDYSTVALYSAMVVYAIAFVFYVVDLAGRSGDAAHAAAPKRSRWLRSAFALTVIAFVLHLAATILRGVAAARVPWANMYEFALTATCAIIAIFLVVQFFVDLRFLGTLATGLSISFLGVAKVNYYVEIAPLVVVLESPWLVIHILVAVLSVGFFTLSFGLAVLQLLQTNRLARKQAALPPRFSFMADFPNAVRLEDLGYRLAIIGFAFWTFTVIAGSIWAERSWSRYWGWDVKEVWSFIIWVLYAGFIHARATRGWRGTRSAWLNIVAYGTVIFNFTVVNVYFDGLHAYSGL